MNTMPSGVALAHAEWVDPNKKTVIIANINFFIAIDCTFQEASGQGWSMIIKGHRQWSQLQIWSQKMKII